MLVMFGWRGLTWGVDVSGASCSSDDAEPDHAGRTARSTHGEQRPNTGLGPNVRTLARPFLNS